MRIKTRWASLFWGLSFFSLLLIGGGNAHAQEPEYVDLAIHLDDIYFSKQELVVGETFRIYATIRNFGNKDAIGSVVFFQGTNPIGMEQPISVKSGGLGDEVFVDAIAPEGSFNIRVLVIVAGDIDTDLGNNDRISKMIYPLVDEDGDMVADKYDNCPKVVNPEQNDIDGNGIGDLCEIVEIPEPVQEQVLVSSDSSVDVEEESAPKVMEKKEVPVKVDIKTDFPSVEAADKEPELYSSEDFENDTGSLDDMKDLLEPNSPDELEDGSLLKPSTNVFIGYKQEKWNTFVFSAVVDIPDYEELEYKWDFGDKNKSASPEIKHVFKSSGIYTVKLSVTDKNGSSLSSEVPIEISFFNLGNPKLWYLIVFLVLLFFGFIVGSIIPLKRKQKEDEYYDVENGEMPEDQDVEDHDEMLVEDEYLFDKKEKKIKLSPKPKAVSVISESASSVKKNIKKTTPRKGKTTTDSTKKSKK